MTLRELRWQNQGKKKESVHRTEEQNRRGDCRSSKRKRQRIDYSSGSMSHRNCGHDVSEERAGESIRGEVPVMRIRSTAARSPKKKPTEKRKQPGPATLVGERGKQYYPSRGKGKKIQCPCFPFQRRTNTAADFIGVPERFTLERRRQHVYQLERDGQSGDVGRQEREYDDPAAWFRSKKRKARLYLSKGEGSETAVLLRKKRPPNWGARNRRGRRAAPVVQLVRRCRYRCSPRKRIQLALQKKVGKERSTRRSSMQGKEVAADRRGKGAAVPASRERERAAPFRAIGKKKER